MVPCTTTVIQGFGPGAVSKNSILAADGIGAIPGMCGDPMPHECFVVSAELILDNDGDTIPDSYEEGPVDINGDGDTDIDLSNPNTPGGPADSNRKDIYVEVDWMDCQQPGSDDAHCGASHNHNPRDAAINDVISAFANAPVHNPNDSEDGGAPGTCSDNIDNGGDGKKDWESRSQGSNTDCTVVGFDNLKASHYGPGTADPDDLAAWKQVYHTPSTPTSSGRG